MLRTVASWFHTNYMLLTRKTLQHKTPGSAFPLKHCEIFNIHAEQMKSKSPSKQWLTVPHNCVFCPGGMKSRADSADEFSPVEVWAPPTSGPGFTNSAPLWEQPSCQFIEQKWPGFFWGVYYQIKSIISNKSDRPTPSSPSTHFLGKTSISQAYMHWICAMGSLPGKKSARFGLYMRDSFLCRLGKGGRIVINIITSK